MIIVLAIVLLEELLDRHLQREKEENPSWHPGGGI